jgi:hypothetical protein
VPACVQANAPALAAPAEAWASTFALVWLAAAAAVEEPNTDGVTVFAIEADPPAVEAPLPKAVKALLPLNAPAAPDPEAVAAELLNAPPKGLVIDAAGMEPKGAEAEAAPGAARPKGLLEPKLVEAPNAGAVEPNRGLEVVTPNAGEVKVANALVVPKAVPADAAVDPNSVEDPNAAPELPKVPQAGPEAGAVLEGAREKAGTDLLGCVGLAVGVPGVTAESQQGIIPCLMARAIPSLCECSNDNRNSLCLCVPAFLWHDYQSKRYCPQMWAPYQPTVFFYALPSGE